MSTPLSTCGSETSTASIGTQEQEASRAPHQLDIWHLQPCGYTFGNGYGARVGGVVPAEKGVQDAFGA